MQFQKNLNQSKRVNRMKIYKELLRVVDLVKSKVDDKVRTELRNKYTTIDSAPKDLRMMEDVVRDFLMGEGNYSEGDTVLCLGRLYDFWSDPTYNRPDEINYGKCIQNVHNVGGYSNNAADVLSGFLRTNERDIGKVTLTKGNHRTTMKYLVEGSNEVRVPIALKLHKRSCNLEQVVEIEAKDHTRDCSYRAPQKGDSKFKSNYYANESWAIDLFEYAKQFSIGIAGTLPDAKFSLPSHSYLSRARKIFKDAVVSSFLIPFTQKNCTEESGGQIYGNTIVAGSGFIHWFGDVVAEVDKKEGVDSFGDMLQFYFHDWKPLMELIGETPVNVKQEDITDASSYNNPPTNEPGIARFVYLYNAYCRRNKYILKQTAKTIIPFDGSEKSSWQKFQNSVPEGIKPEIYRLANTKFF